MIKRSKAGDKGARDSLVLDNVGLIWSIVRRFSNRGYELEDLFQVGCIGMIKAIDKFDLSFDVKFSTYAVPMISGEIKRFLRDDGMIKISRSLKEQAYRISLAREQFQCKYHREATMEELSEMTQISLEEMTVALEANREVESLNRTISDGEGSKKAIQDFIEEKCAWEENVMDRMVLYESFQILNEAERRLIYLRYFENKTQKEIGTLLGVSQVQVSRLEKKILMELRKCMRQENS